MRKRILFIDDDVKRFDSHIDFLQEHYDVTKASTVPEALNALEKRRDEFSLVIMDVMLPSEGPFTDEDTDYARRTGIAMLKYIRREREDLPVVMFSVVRDADVQSEAMENGAKEFIEKPIRPSVLVEKVRHIFKNLSMASQSAAV